jgi:hypothetical protein
MARLTDKQMERIASALAEPHPAGGRLPGLG